MAKQNLGAVRTDLHTLEYYDVNSGWKMFDLSTLNQEVFNYLSFEVDVLNDLVSKKEKYDHLVECGAGYGRLIDWAYKHGISYDGIEIVSWMARLATARLRNLQKGDKFRKAFIHNASVVDFDFHGLHEKSRTKSRLVFFPFNLVGNIVSLEKLFENLRYVSCDALVSCFNDSEEATHVRLEYYHACGAKNLEVKQSEVGVCISSEDGLSSIAYSRSRLERFFAMGDFKIEQTFEKDKVSTLYLLKRSKKAPLRIVQNETRDLYNLGSGEVNFFLLCPVEGSNERTGLFNISQFQVERLVIKSESEGILRSKTEIQEGSYFRAMLLDYRIEVVGEVVKSLGLLPSGECEYALRIYGNRLQALNR